VLGKAQTGFTRSRRRHGAELPEVPVQHLVEEEPWIVLYLPGLATALAIVVAGLVWLAVSAAPRI